MTWRKAQCFAALEQAVVPAGLINTVEEALANPHIVTRVLQIAPEGCPVCAVRCAFHALNWCSTGPRPKSPSAGRPYRSRRYASAHRRAAAAARYRSLRWPP